MHCSIDYFSGDRPWLLLVHGMLTSSQHWLLNQARLERHFNLVRVDLPGHGRSPPPDNMADLTADSLVAGFERIRAELGVERWAVCGQSFGAGLTLKYALTFPERVNAQAFTNARVVLREYGPEDAEERAARLDRLRMGGMAALERERFHPRFAKRFPADIQALLCEDAGRIDVPTHMRMVGEIAPHLSMRGVPNSEPKVPTLLINGRYERAFQDDRMELAELWQRLEIVDLEGGHSVNIENPEAFDFALIDFLETHR